MGKWASAVVALVKRTFGTTDGHMVPRMVVHVLTLEGGSMAPHDNV
jgi:hypothetical protein